MNALLTILVVAATGAATPDERPQWTPDYGEALSAAKAADKPLLVVIEHPHDAARQDPAVHAAADISQDGLLGAYELCRVDASTSYGRRVADAFRAQRFPYVAVIDRTGTRVLFRQGGPLTNDQWAETLVAFREGRAAPNVRAAQPRQTPFCFT